MQSGVDAIQSIIRQLNLPGIFCPSMPDTLTLADADYLMRHWTHPDAGPIEIGSDAHKTMFCEMLLATHNPYKPAVIEWPVLPPDQLRRITSLPIWDIAVQTEGRASIRVATYAATIEDPLLREALTLDGNEEARHKIVLSKLVQAYGIQLGPEPHYPPPANPARAWLFTGYSECVDSFFAFGLFEAARQSGFFPPELVETFEPVIQEEARHILFFANWVAWYRRGLPWHRRFGFKLQEIRVWITIIRERIGLARSMDTDQAPADVNFPVNASDKIGITVTTGTLIDICLTENERRMAGYDARLLRPTSVPRLARLARRFIR
jgi:hypothetical protein